ncbi:hypothetical protein [Nonomuraea sp. NPDC003754]
MTREQVYALGEVSVAVATDHPEVLAYLDDFYAPHTGQRRPYWRVQARLATPSPVMDVDGYGVGYRADPRRRHLQVWSADAAALQIGVRKAVREVMVAYCERQRYAMLHASAVHKDGLLVVIAGDKGAGKTTLALDAVLRHGFDYVSNDHLIVYPDPDGQIGLVVTSLPTPIPVKIGTYLAMEELLPEPWDGCGVDVDRYRAMPAEQRRGLEVRLDYTFASFGQPNPVAVPCAGPGKARVVVVFPEFAPAAGERPRPGGGSSELEKHLRLDWVFDAAYNPRHLPYERRTVGAFVADGQALIGELCRSAHLLTWRHDGDMRPLLETLDAGEAA